MFLSLQTYLQASISQFEKISQMIFLGNKEASSSPFSCCSVWTVATHMVTLGFMGQLLLYHNLSPPKFPFIALTWHYVFIFKTFLNSDWRKIVTKGTNICLKTLRIILARSNSRIERYVYYGKTRQLEISHQKSEFCMPYNLLKSSWVLN